MFRVSTFASHQLNLSQTMQTQARLQNGQIQVSSGKTSADYAGLASESQSLISLENNHELLGSFMSNIDVTDRRLQGMETNVAGIFDVASEFRVLLISALNANNAAMIALNENAQLMLDEVVGMLNFQQDDRFLFSGSMIETTPVDVSAFDPDNVAYDPSDPTLANFGYYAGDSAILSVRIGEAVTASYGVTADDPGFEKLLRALELARTAAASPAGIDRARLQTALGLVNEAIQEIPNIQSQIGASRKAMEQTKQIHMDFRLYAEGIIGDIENVDVPEALTRITADQLQLEASYMVTSRLASVSLLNYLR